MKQYSPSAYESAYNTLEVYQTGIKTLKDAGYYVIGRITAFNDPHLAEDHPECVIADQAGDLCRSAGCTGQCVQPVRVAVQGGAGAGGGPTHGL